MKHIDLRLRLGLLPFVLLFVPHQHGFGQNHSIAYAYPIQDITVDGNLDDWSEVKASYPIQLVYGNNPPKDKQDIQASFKIAYNIKLQMIYVAVEVMDDFHIRDETDQANWASMDNHILYLDIAHSVDHSGILSYLYSKDYRTIFQPENSWDPQVRQANWNNITVQSTTSSNKTTYEWAIHLDGLVHANQSMGMDHMLIDRDEGDDANRLTIMSWGPGDPKHIMTGSMGDVLLLEEKTVLTPISGQIAWTDKASASLSQKIRIQSLEHEHLWVETKTNELGEFSVDLPHGSYKASLAESKMNLSGKGLVRMDPTLHLLIDTQKEATTDDNRLELAMWEPEAAPFEEGWLFQFDDTQSEKLDELIADLMTYYEVPGVSLAFIKEDEMLYHKNYGYKNAYTKELVEETTLFEAASITKPVFAYSVMRLAEKGIIDLDKPLVEYMPLSDMNDARYELMTARHVLSHSSGFPNFGRRLLFTPGTQYGYSGEGMDYLSKVLESITQKDIVTILNEEVIQPLQLSYIYFKDSDYVRAASSFGHIGKSPRLLSIPAEPNMAFSMFTEAKSFTGFMIELLTREGLNSSTFEAYLSNETAVPEDKATGLGSEEHFGLGIHLIDSPYGRIIGHGGSNGDFQCQFDIYEEKKMGFILFTNSDNGMNMINAFRRYAIHGTK